MGASVNNVAINTYETTVRHLAQQGVARLRPWVMERSVQSEAHNWERLGTQEAQPKVGRYQDTPVQDYPWSRRRSTPNTWDTGDTTEHEEIAEMLVDPNSNIALAQGKAMGRAFDKEIIKAAVGTSLDGQNQPVPFDTDQEIGSVGTPVPMSYDLVTEVAEKFMAKDVDPEEEKVFVIGPKQARKIMQMTEATSSDYNHARDLVTKYYVPHWMGFTWIVSNLLEDPADDGTQRHIFAMTRRAIGLQVNKDVWTRIAEDPSKSFVWRIYAAAHFGAVRVEDEHLVRVFCQNTI